MPKRVVTGTVTSDSAAKTRRVEVPRIVRHTKYGKILHRRTVCHVHDENEESAAGDTVEIIESRPRSRLKRWELVRVVAKSTAVDVASLRSGAVPRGSARVRQRRRKQSCRHDLIRRRQPSCRRQLRMLLVKVKRQVQSRRASEGSP